MLSLEAGGLGLQAAITAVCRKRYGRCTPPASRNDRVPFRGSWGLVHVVAPRLMQRPRGSRGDWLGVKEELTRSADEGLKAGHRRRT